MKSIITSDIITKVSNDSKLQTNSLTPYIFSSYDVIGIGAIKIIIHGNEYHLDLHEDVGKTYLKVWSEDVGKLITTDLRKNDKSHFYEFKTPTYKVLLRKIDDDKIDEMKELGFCHIVIGDYYYTIIKLVNNNENYAKINTSIDESLQDKHEDEEPEEENVNIDEIAEVESLSLFD
jgi:hypothetical protein